MLRITVFHVCPDIAQKENKCPSGMEGRELNYLSKRIINKYQK